MEEDKIVLDRKSFEALAVDSRVRILKSLKERRKTLSEIAKEQKMSLSGVKEHLETLERVGLIEKIDDGHKWKYYELTRKGEDIVAPRELRVWILLSLSTIALVASMFFILPAAPQGYPAEATALDRSMEPAPMLATADTGAGTADAEADMVAGGAEQPEAYAAEAPAREKMNGLDGREAPPQEPGGPPAVPLAVAAISAVTLLGCIGILVRNRVTSP